MHIWILQCPQNKQIESFNFCMLGLKNEKKNTFNKHNHYVLLYFLKQQCLIQCNILMYSLNTFLNIFWNKLNVILLLAFLYLAFLRMNTFVHFLKPFIFHSPFNAFCNIPYSTSGSCVTVYIPGSSKNSEFHSSYGNLLY